MEETCSWLLEHESYQSWLQRRSLGQSQGLIRIKGNPGSGKSTIMKAAFKAAAKDLAPQGVCVTSFFFNAKGSDLEKTALGFYRSILYQILRNIHARDQLERFTETFGDALLPMAHGPNEDMIRYENEFKSFLHAIFREPGMPRTVIFVDALDECDDDQRELSYYLRTLTTSAFTAGVALDICMSCRHFPAVTLANCPEIVMEHFNDADITFYVQRRLQVGGVSHDGEGKYLMDKIVTMASGVFLWVVLVVDILLEDRDEGKSIKQLETRLESVPATLQNLLEEIIRGITKNRAMVCRLFQWATLSLKPLRLREWHQIFAFLGGECPSSLKEWRQSREYIGDYDQLEKRIRSLSRGLVEVKSSREALNEEDQDFDSVAAGAGSLDSDHGETRIIQVIHESVRQFLLFQGGFLVLDPTLTINPIGAGHLAIMAMCLNYLQISELDALAEARVAGFQSSVSLISSAEEERPSQGTRDISRHTSTFKRADLIFYNMASEADRGIRMPAQAPGPSFQLRTTSSPRRSEDSCSVGSFSSAGSADYRSPDISFNKMKQEAEDHSRSEWNVTGSLRNYWKQGFEENFEPRSLTNHKKTTSINAFNSNGTSTFDQPLFSSTLEPNIQALASESWRPRSVLDILPPASLQRRHSPQGSSNCLATGQSDDTKAGNLALGMEAENINFRPEQKSILPESSVRSTSPPAPSVMGTSHASSIYQLEVLEDYPALLSYASMMLFRHARAAQSHDGNPESLVRRLKDKKAWKRLLGLREDLPLDTTLETYCVMQGLETWISTLLDIPSEKYSQRAFACFETAVRHGKENVAAAVLAHEVKVSNSRAAPGRKFVDRNILHYIAHSDDPLLISAYRGQAKKLLERNRIRKEDLETLVNSRDGTQQTPLLIASARESSHVAKDLLCLGADPNSRDILLRTPLHLACARDNPDPKIIETLLEFYAEPNTEDTFNQPPIVAICERSTSSLAPTVELLLRYGTNPNSIGMFRTTALHNASKNRAGEVIEILLRFGAEVDWKDSTGNTPLHHACSSWWEADMKNSLRCVELLLQAGANVNAKNGNRETPIDLARKTMFDDAVKLMAEHQ
jgi:ankyrin repeat protein